MRRSIPFLLGLAALLGSAPAAGVRADAAGPASPPGVSAGFAAFWQAHEGALLFGQPLGPEYRAGDLTVQNFERARMEWHPDYPPGRQITLGLIGNEARAVPRRPESPAFPSNPAHRYFPETRHSVQGAILAFWQAHGGLPIFGYPLSEELQQDGHTAQYFQRALLESHPELTAAGYPVLPAPLNVVENLRFAGPGTVVLEPPEIQQGHTALIKVIPPPGATIVAGSLGGNALSFACCLPVSAGGLDGAQPPWALAGVPSDAAGIVPLVVTLALPDGSTQRIIRSIPVRAYPYPTYRTTYYGPRTPSAVRDAEHAIIDAVVAGRSGPPRWTGRWQFPLHIAPDLTAPFGERRAYNAEPPYEIHGGADYAAPSGTGVYAPAPGTVVLARTLALRGNCLIVDHGGGVFTLYAHLSAFRVHAGQVVLAGNLLGLVGMTGNATGPHLHWEVHASGPEVLPQEWLDRSFP